MSMEKLRCPICSHYALCSIGGEITDQQARTCKAYSYIPTPSAPRPIHSHVDHYDVDVATGTVSYHVVRTNGDRIRAMSDEELAIILTESFGCPPDGEQKRCFGRDIKCYDCALEWLKEEAQYG